MEKLRTEIKENDRLLNLTSYGLDSQLSLAIRIS
jgi:hypothetical protein